MQSACYTCHILMKLECSRQIFEKYSNIKFNENPSSGSRVVPCGQTDKRIDVTKIIIPLRDFANVPKNVFLTLSIISCSNCVPIFTRVVPKVMSNFFLLANWEQQTKESAVVDGTSCCVILECLVTSIACIT